MVRTLLMILLLGCHVHISAGETKEDFETFISSLPQNTLKDHIFVQSHLFDLLQSYRESKDALFPYEHFHPNEHYGDYGEYHALESQVNVGVVFVGFPDNSIPRLRDLFFNDLERRDHLHIGEQQARHVHVTASPGSARINHQFHVVDTSFHADETVRRFMQLLQRPYPNSGSGRGSGSEYYLNAWEVEEALDSLNWHMQHHLNEGNKLRKKKPSLTVFVLNLPLVAEADFSASEPTVGNSQANSHETRNYLYLNTFSPEDLDRIRRNETCFRLAKELVQEKSDAFDTTRKVFEHDKRAHVPSLHREYTSAAEVDESHTTAPISEDQEEASWNEYYSDYSEGEEDSKPSEDSDDGEHFRLNEVHSSKAWSRGWAEDFLSPPSVMSLEQRVIRILRTTDPLSTFSRYKHDLARDIVLGRPVDLDIGGENDNPGVSWVGSGGVAWLDLNAMDQSGDGDRESESESESERMFASLRKVLNYKDMSLVNAEERGGRGDEGVYQTGGNVGEEFSFKAELMTLRHSLHQHYLHCESVLLHLRQKEKELEEEQSIETGEEARSHLRDETHDELMHHLPGLPELQASGSANSSHKRDDLRENRVIADKGLSDFDKFSSMIRENQENGHMSKFSAILYLQQGLISYSLELSVRLELMDEVVTAEGSESDVEGGAKEYYVELMEFHCRLLAEMIEVSNMFVGKGHYSRKGFSSRAIHDALATVSSSVLELSRILLSKPVTVMPHSSHMKDYMANQERIRQSIESSVEKDRTVAEVDPVVTNAFSLLKDLKEDDLSSAVLRGMQKDHQEVLLTQVHLAQSERSSHSGGYSGGYDDDYSYGHRFRDFYQEDGPSSSMKKAEGLLTSATLTPPILVPKYLEIEVYVVRMQDSYPSVVQKDRKGSIVKSVKFDARASLYNGEGDGDSDNGLGQSLGFDMSSFMSEVRRLKLENQQMSITVHTVNGPDEPSLYLGLAGCRRYRSDMTAGSWGGGEWVDSNVSHYYSADCVWRHLQHSESVDTGDVDSTTELPETQHLAMFLLSVDSLSPFYLDSQEDDELHQAVTFGDSILVIQNKQVSIPCTHATSIHPAATAGPVSSSSSFSRGAADKRRVEVRSWNGRNPLRPALEASSKVLLGMGSLSQHTSVSKQSHAKTHLTPLRVSAEHYSDLELAAAFRNRILRSVDFGEALEDYTTRDIRSVGHEYVPEHYVYLNAITSKVLQELENFNWEKAAVLSNMLVKIAWKKRRHFDEFVHRQKCLNNDKKTFDLIEFPDDSNDMGYGRGYMDDDYQYHHMYGSGGRDEDEDREEDGELVAASLVSICVLLFLKVMFVATLTGVVLYALYFATSRVAKNLARDKSMML